ncbi:nuclear transport factor 2 family protein [Mucilaginibacter sp.]|uniref:nuclear transport factor 2 family protein n=1 Tax=Mucilaginibacter sp. TaxID=1882438 RepID=UPI002ED13748
MKLYFLIGMALFAFGAHAQSPDETKVLKLSADIFRWEVDNKIDSLDNAFYEKFVVISSKGVRQPKKQYLTTLKSGNFTHNSVVVSESNAVVADNTAVVTGKGMFTVTVNGQKNELQLSFIEVFSRPNSRSGWKVLALQANHLQN